MARPKKETLSEAVSKELKSKFNLSNFKNKKGLEGQVKFKEPKWIPFSPALQEAISIPGIPMGHITTVRGKSDTGKTTTAVELAVSAQKMNILPVIIITEMKHSWTYWKKMGFQIEDVKDKEGNVIDHEGFFIYRDRSSLSCIEDVAAFMVDMLDEQDKGNLPYDLLFIWDSVGSIPCEMSIKQGKNNPMWNAGAIATQFGNFINQKVILSRKEHNPYTNTFLIVNKTGVAPADGPMAKPKMTNKGGDTFYFDSSIVITFGNIMNSGTSRIRAVKDGKKVEYALRTKVAVSKNHITGLATAGTIVSTAYGFIGDSPSEISKYKKAHSSDWVDILGKGATEDEEDSREWDEKPSVGDYFIDNDEEGI